MSKADSLLHPERDTLPYGQDRSRLKILVIQQKMIGDVLISSIICEALKKKYPSAHIHYVVNSYTIPVTKENPFIDKIIEFKNEHSQSIGALFNFAKQIKQSKYDLVIDAYGKWESNIITLFSGAKEKISFYKWYTSFMYTKTIRKQSEPLYNHSIAVENRIRLLFAEKDVKSHLISPKIYLTETEKTMATSFLKSYNIDIKKTLLMISVLGSSPNKTYPAAYMAKLLDSISLQYPDAQILFNYVPDQLMDAKEIYDLTSAFTRERIFFEVYGSNLREFLAITYHCRALIGNEGGATNMAKAMQIPTFVIFSPYLNKSNWFGNLDEKLHQAVHLSEYIPYKDGDLEKAKNNPEAYYLKFKPTFIQSKLEGFLKRIL